MKTNIWFFLIFLSSTMFSEIIWAEPYMAVRSGYKCSQCHFNKTGGGKRTDFGVLYSQYQLDLFGIAPDSGAGSSFNTQLNETVSIGANLRTDLTHQFKHVPDTAQDSTLKVIAEEQNLSNQEANFYLQAQLIPGLFHFYYDMAFLPGTGTREMFGMLEFPANSWVKVGYMLLPYGYRMLDNDAFIRKRTNFTYSRTNLAMEIGTEPGPFSFVFNSSLVEWSTVSSFTWKKFRLGGSYANDVGNETDYLKFFGGPRQIYGVFGGATFGRFTLIGEVDRIHETINDTAIAQQAYLAELDVHVIKGLSLRTVYEYWNNREDVPNKRDGRDRITMGFNLFPISFLELSMMYTINRGPPKQGEDNQDKLFAQFHTYF